MRSFAVKAGGVLVAVVAGVFALAQTADASHVEAEVVVPQAAAVGQPTELQIALHSAEDGQALSNVPVTVYANASFAGVEGDVVLGTAVTDENGVAVLDYEPRSSGEHNLRVEYIVPGETEPEAAATKVIVEGAATQIHTSASGIQVPGLNVWLIIALVAGVWSALLTVGLRVFAIARAAPNGEVAIELEGAEVAIELKGA